MREEELARMQQEMSKLFEMTFGIPMEKMICVAPQNTKMQSQRQVIHPINGEQLQNTQYRVPRVHVAETETMMLATAELPGVLKKDIEVTIKEDHIEIRTHINQSEQMQEKPENNEFMQLRQRAQFYRKIPLDVPVQAQKAKAEYKDGILRIEIPKQEEHQTKVQID